MTSPRSKTKAARRRLHALRRYLPPGSPGTDGALLNAIALGFGLGFACCALWVAVLIRWVA